MLDFWGTGRRNRSARGVRRHALAALTAMTMLTLSGVTTGVATAKSPRRKATPAMHVSVRIGASGHTIPRGFFGLSMEYNEMPTYLKSGVLFNRVVNMIRPYYGGPMSLRLGGKSADHAIWEAPANSGKSSAPRVTSLPNAQGVFAVNETWLEELRQLVRQENLHVTLDLNLVVHSPSLETNFAVAASHVLPAGTLAGVEIGNEPDMYHFQPPLADERVSSTPKSLSRDWWAHYSPADYRADFLTYAKALRAKLPHIPLVGPEITNSNPSWLESLRGLGHDGPAYLTLHRYASSTCWSKKSPYYPSIPLLLSDHVSAGLAGSVDGAVQDARDQGIGLRLDEVNSVSCGGKEDIAASFATALWAPDVLFEMIEAGVDGISWHIRPGTLNAPFHFTSRGIEAFPELYGLSIFSDMTHGPGDLVHRGYVSSRTPINMTAWAVTRGGSEDVLLINKSGHRAIVSVPERPGHRSGYVEHLLAPKVSSTFGVTFGGRSIGSDALWQGKLKAPKVRASKGYYHLTLPRYSASLLVL